MIIRKTDHLEILHLVDLLLILKFSYLTFILHIIVQGLAYLPLKKKERKEKKRKVQREKRSHPHHQWLVHGSRNSTC